MKVGHSTGSRFDPPRVSGAETSGGAAMTNLFSAMVVGQTGVGAIEYGAFAAIIAIMIMFVVETVSLRR
jgi:hypothetical protein